MKINVAAILLLAAGSSLLSCNTGTSTTASQDSFISKANIDSSVKPGDNFYLYVNGKWQGKAVIPETDAMAGAFMELYNSTKANLKMILDSAADHPGAPGSISQKVGDFYASGTDSVTIEKLGYDPIKPILQKIDGFKDVPSIMEFEAGRHKENFGYVVSLAVFADLKKSSVNILNATQTGLGLPDRDYYFKTDSATLAIQKAYMTYMHKLLMLTGDDSLQAIKNGIVIYALEKQIAGSHLTNVQLRNPKNTYDKMAVAAINKTMPHIGWETFLKNVGVHTDSINIAQPAYYKKLNDLLPAIPINTWKAYYRFHVADDAANYLSNAFVTAKFDYSRKALYGQKQIKPRWDRVYQVVDNNLGDALGELYVDRFFKDSAKKRMLELVNNLQIAFDNRISHLEWMSDSTKTIAKAKLKAFIKKIGFPNTWRDYSKVTIKRDTYFENVLSSSRNEFQYQIAKVDKPVDKTEWDLSAPTINAYYNPTFNEIVFPAGILQLPYFGLTADDAINYGAIGVIIGHEMTHGFDDEGAQFDKDGNLKNWWGKSDSLLFVAKSKKVIHLYDGFTILDSVHVNGSLTTGENIADLGGVSIAYDAFKLTPQGKDTSRIGGLTPDQRFFISFAQGWREKTKPELQLLNVNTDVHSPSMYRVNGPLMNFDPFYAAFDVKPGDKMYLPDSSRIKIW